VAYMVPLPTFILNAYQLMLDLCLLQTVAAMEYLPLDGEITVAVDDDSSQYLEDPSLFRDELPQPFRMINKLLDQILDCAWDVIADRLSIAVKNASRKQAPQYSCTTVMHVRSHESFC
jgi:hypothetical protein